MKDTKADLFIIEQKRNNFSLTCFWCHFHSLAQRNIKNIFDWNIFEMAPMLFPCNGLLLCWVNLPKVLLMFLNKFDSCSIPYFNFFIVDGLVLALNSLRLFTCIILLTIKWPKPTLWVEIWYIKRERKIKEICNN